MTEHNSTAPGEVVVTIVCFAVLIFFALPDLVAWIFWLPR